VKTIKRVMRATIAIFSSINSLVRYKTLKQSWKPTNTINKRDRDIKIVGGRGIVMGRS